MKFLGTAFEPTFGNGLKNVERPPNPISAKIYTVISDTVWLEHGSARSRSNNFVHCTVGSCPHAEVEANRLFLQ